MFDAVDPRQSFPALERAMLQYWREEDMFRRSIANREGRTEFSFYDGPPFATGLPHYGHLLAGTIKDVIPRYRTMRGDKVRRRFGWDCHGLPVENLIEKEEGIKSKRDIEAMGVARFNELCKASVQRYVKEWRETVERTGRWVDMDWDYRTMDPSYMESIWWVFKSLSDKNLIYEGYKPMHVCPRCVTPLSNFEVTQGYKDVTDQSAIVKFALTEEKNTYLLAWTTTPWTLPGNLFVAVGADIKYVKVAYNNDTYIVAEERVESIFKESEFTISGKAFAGKKLEGMTYVPLFDYFAKDYPDAFCVVTGDFVSTEEGTGLVHIAPGFGEDDFRIGQQEKAEMLQHVTIEGKFIPDVTDFAGQDVKPADDPAKTDRKVIEWLEKHGKLFSSESYRHSYPHCWRCDSPLLNYATSSWFVEVEKIKEKMLTSNSETEWVPAHIRDGRFGNWLSNARDWAISRNRYWGTPLPVWRTEDGSSVDVIGGRQELMDRCRLRFSKVTVIRHGQAEHNVGGFYQCTVPGVDLTETGRQQAKDAAAFLANQNVKVIYCSPLARTQQTAQAIADATGAEIVIDERLREIDVGEYEGKAFDRSDYALHALLRKKKLQEGAPESVFHLEGMEKWTDVQKRADAFLRDTLHKHRSDHIVIVTHADVVMNFRHFFTKEDPFKLSHRPYPRYATPEQYYWDHNRQEEMDLHKHVIDDIQWTLPDAGTPVEATLVRHGETDWNKEKRVHGGNADVPLNDAGRRQGMDLAESLKKRSFDMVLTSDLARASETASIIAKHLGLSEPVAMEILRERDVGIWSGKKVHELLLEHPPAEEGIVALHHDTPEGGESLSAFIRRMQKAYDEITRTYAGKKVLIVTHRAVIQALSGIAGNLSYRDAALMRPVNAEATELIMHPLLKRIPDVLDCWFESGSMPYAQANYPYSYESQATSYQLPAGFPADFIAEGIDQTRGWFYTLTVLSSALFEQSAFRHCVVNGIVLAEDGRKMSKRLKNYPEPTEIVEKYGADAMRFALMHSPAVRGEDMRFSEKTVEEAVRNVLLPFWNSYSFFVTYANLAAFDVPSKPASSNHPLDRWILAEVQDLCNRMTKQLDAYDLSATCDELFETIDALTNWYIRLSRRRFAGKGMSDRPEAEPENFEGDRTDALVTLHQALLTISQLLAPFCPFMTDAVYLNLSGTEHSSVHLTDWPAVRELTDDERKLIAKNRLLRRIVSLGLTIRSNAKVKVRTPLMKATVAFPAGMLGKDRLGTDEIALLRQELNVKEVIVTDDPGSLGERYAMVDARKVGPRLGKGVQEVIQAGKRGEFEIADDGSIRILDETLSPDEAQVLYRGARGSEVQADAGVVVALDTVVSEELELEGLARDLIRAIQKLRKEQGYALGEPVTIGLDDAAEKILAVHRNLIEQETSVTVGTAKGQKHETEIGDTMMTVYMDPKF
jgi:isoleucyl-tRNA synthetase/bisphosphoglycerate-dependent phosphoglycerate mutase